MSENKIRMPWWFWFAAVLGMLSFVPLSLAGIKVKNWFWVALSIIQLMWLWLSPLFDSETLFNIFTGFSVVLGIYVFTFVRKRYLMEIENPTSDPQSKEQMQKDRNDLLESRKKESRTRRTKKARRLPWWFWIGVVLTFVPLLVAGFKLKKWFWIGLGFAQIIWLFWPVDVADEVRSRFTAFFWFSLGLLAYVFIVVRAQYLVEMEIRERNANKNGK